MDFRRTDDQVALQEGIASFCADRFALERLPEIEAAGFDRALWRELAEMGTFSLRLPESEGGVGLATADSVLVFEELGRCLAPGPIVWTHLAAGIVEGAGSGDTVVGGLDLCGPSSEPVLVEHCDALDVLLVLRPDGAYRLDPGTLDTVPVDTPLDPLTPLHHVASLPEGERIGDAALTVELRLEGGALVSALLLGLAQGATALAVDYAKKREQFGRAIGSFQSLKHLMADAFVRQEVARAAVYAAGATLDDPEIGEPGRAVSAAKVTAGEAAMRNARTCIQVHGGMGYTWEIPAHYFLKRTWVLESVFGTTDEHADLGAALVEERAASA